MPGLLTRLMLALITLGATAWAGGVVLGASSAVTEVTELVVTCLSCGQKWLYAPSASVGAGLLSIVRLRRPADKCPRCGSRVVAFGHLEEGAGQHQGRSA